MMYLLDSDILINFLNGDKEIISIVSKMKKDGLSTSIICVAEILEDLFVLKQKKKSNQFKEFIKTIRVLTIDERVAETFAKIRGELRKRGKLIDNFDLLIGATCLANDLILATGNLSHFQRIPGLKFYKIF